MDHVRRRRPRAAGRLALAGGGALVLGLLAPLARGDTLITKDGQRLKGKVVAETETELTLEGKYGSLIVQKADVLRRKRDAETLELKDGSRLVGEVVWRSGAELILKTAFGTLVVPSSALRAGARAEAAPRPTVRRDPARIRRLHLEAARMHRDQRYREAIALYAELLEMEPQDDTALYNTACAHSLLGEKDLAVAFLGRSVRAGFANFQHIRRDSDLDAIRREPGYLELLAQEAEWVRKAAVETVGRLKESLRAQGARGDYQVEVDEVHDFIYLHAKSPERLAKVRAQMEEYARIQWRDLFPHKVRRPLHIVLLTRADGAAVLDRGVGGFFNPQGNTLICGDLASMKLNRSNVVVHELTHALHFADQAARRQQHPIWLVEGLATLFESVEVQEDRLIPRHSARLTTVQAALARGRTLPWRRLMQLDHQAFMDRASLAYAEARYVLFYMWEKGALKRFYDEYTSNANYRGDRSAQESFEVVFGRPVDEVERDWERWIRAQRAPLIPFIGVSSSPVEAGLRIDTVARNSGAERAGVQKNDVLVSIDGSPVKVGDDLLELLSTRDVGDTIELELIRGDKRLRLDVILGKRPR